MASPTRPWFPGASYHITNRGNHKDTIFYDSEDYSTYLSLLKNNLTFYKDSNYKLICYCLMKNHVHLLLMTDKSSPSSFMRRLNSLYSKYFNEKYNYVGHLFQERYFSNLITSDFELLEVSRYIHLNPVKANIVKIPDNYPWSSYNYIVSNNSLPKTLPPIYSDILLDTIDMYFTLEENISKGVQSKLLDTCESLPYNKFNSNKLNGNKITGDKVADDELIGNEIVGDKLAANEVYNNTELPDNTKLLNCLNSQNSFELSATLELDNSSTLELSDSFELTNSSDLSDSAELNNSLELTDWSELNDSSQLTNLSTFESNNFETSSLNLNTFDKNKEISINDIKKHKYKMFVYFPLRQIHTEESNMNFQERILLNELKLNDTDDQIIEYINLNTEKVINQSIQKTAESLFTVPNSIVRLSKKLGYNGFSEMKFALKQELESNLLVNNGSISNLNLTNTLINKNNYISANNLNNKSISTKLITEKLKTINYAPENIVKTLDLINNTMIEKTVKKINDCKNIKFLGIGDSIYFCEMFCKNLRCVGKRSEFFQHSHDMMYSVANCDNKDLYIAVSVSGESTQIIEAAKKAKERGAYIISMTHFSDNTLSKISDLKLFFWAPREDKNGYNSTDRVGLMILLRILSEAYWNSI